MDTHTPASAFLKPGNICGDVATVQTEDREGLAISVGKHTDITFDPELVDIMSVLDDEQEESTRSCLRHRKVSETFAVVCNREKRRGSHKGHIQECTAAGKFPKRLFIRSFSFYGQEDPRSIKSTITTTVSLNEVKERSGRPGLSESLSFDVDYLPSHMSKDTEELDTPQWGRKNVRKTSSIKKISRFGENESKVRSHFSHTKDCIPCREYKKSMGIHENQENPNNLDDGNFLKNKTEGDLKDSPSYYKTLNDFSPANKLRRFTIKNHSKSKSNSDTRLIFGLAVAACVFLSLEIFWSQYALSNDGMNSYV
jgi:hypothetical protein